MSIAFTSRSNELVRSKLQDIVPNKSPGVHYSFFNVDSVLFDYYTGKADLKNDIPISEKTTFHYFSNTKTFTAVAIMQLQEEGKLSIEDPLHKHLANIPYSKDITIKHLLNHTSGIPNPIPLSWIHLSGEDADYDHDSFFKNTIDKNHKTKFSPNSKYAYSNIEYLLLAEIVRKVSGKDFRTYLSENVFPKIGDGQQKLGFSMDYDHAIGYHNKRSFSNLLLGLFMNKKKYMSKAIGKWKPFNNFQLNGHGYSGLIATHEAMQSYMQELLKDDSKVLSHSSVEALFTENILNNGKNSGMCLSWFKGELNGTTYFAHAGGGGGYYSELRIYPSLGYGSVISFNRSGMTDERILDKFDKHFIDQSL
jgi:CubicO group peptidase (beta-lactamase class C family)